MWEWEQASWTAGCEEEEVIRHVGRIVGARARELTAAGDRILILAGKGHNGDDARTALPHLGGREVDLLNVASPGEQLAAMQTLLRKRPALILDGLFGIGLNRALSAEWVAFIASVNEAKCPVLAIDTPSGLNADSGQPQPVAVRASITLTLGAPKVGLLVPAALPFAGRLEVAPEIGLIPFVTDADQFWTGAEDFAAYPPRRTVDSHKGTFGHVGLIAGSKGFHGAAVLCAQAAARARPGLVTVWTQAQTYAPIASQLRSAMVDEWRTGFVVPDRISALVIGPGLADPTLGDDFKSGLRNLWREFPKPLLADASALDWLPTGTVLSRALRVITPHPGEAARMLQTSSKSVQSNRARAVGELSTRYGNCWVVLKGHQTMIGCAGSPAFLNSSGNPYLAQGGSGDVLAGYLGGLLAQPALQSDPGLALRYGVWRHGLAADRLSAQGRDWVVEDLVDALENR